MRDDVKPGLFNRLARIEEQVRDLALAVEEDRHRIDVLRQVHAVRPGAAQDGARPCRSVGAHTMRAALLAITATLAMISAAHAQDHMAHDQMTHEHGAHDHMPPEHMPPEHMPHDHMPPDSAMVGAAMMTGALGPYAMTREASGTSWQPDAAPHGGAHFMAGGWTLMGHALINGVYDWQDGPRGDEKAFIAGMIMGSARKDFTHGTLNLRAMVSPDPFMGKSGYPLLLAAGETADGATLLTDRQHPHDLAMELAASYAHTLSDTASVFVYAGLPGEPAFGPPAFMHRTAAADSPEAPISHHWLDSTHITFGVLTAGYVRGDWKIEASRFKGREPDQDRFDIEQPEFDSSAARVSWNPTKHWALQISWADLKSPEQLKPDEDETRYSASALYARPVFGGGLASASFAWGRKDGHHGELDAWLAEAALSPNERWTLFSRAERVETTELGVDDAVETVGKLSLGAIRDWRVSKHAKFGLGGLYAHNWAPDALGYGGDPGGAMAFARLKIE